MYQKSTTLHLTVSTFKLRWKSYDSGSNSSDTTSGPAKLWSLEVGATNATLLNKFDQEPWRKTKEAENLVQKVEPQKLGGGNSNIFFYVHPENIWGRWTRFDEHIFQRGWNHQPENHFPKNPSRYAPGKGDWSELESLIQRMGLEPEQILCY